MLPHSLQLLRSRVLSAHVRALLSAFAHLRAQLLPLRELLNDLRGEGVVGKFRLLGNLLLLRELGVLLIFLVLVFEDFTSLVCDGLLSVLIHALQLVQLVALGLDQLRLLLQGVAQL